ncbi:MAG: chorismate synthase [Clostridia bacterium]|nr:chorismate synthase [Clostridia bacterium]
MIIFNFDGTSHGVGYTGTICGIPKGVCVNINNINSALAIRKSGFGRSSRQNFTDKVVFVGHEQDNQFITDGRDITFFVANTSVETRPNITAVRTGHADFVGTIRHPHLTARDVAEIASARSSLCYVVLGCICAEILKDWNISTSYHVEQIGSVVAQNNGNSDSFAYEPFPCTDKVALSQMMEEISCAKERGDSLGGVAVVPDKVPAGIGEIFPYHKRLDAQLSAHLVGIPSVKGISFGIGNDYASLTGTTSHDKLTVVDGKIAYQTNNCGGIVGGVTTGQDIVIKLVVKPVPTVKGVTTIDTETLQSVSQQYERADTCVVPNVGFIAQHIVNYVLANQVLEQYNQNPNQLPKR